MENTNKTEKYKAIPRFLAPGLIIAGFLYGALTFGDLFWLWITRSFELSFIFYTVGVIYGIYVFLPKLGVSIVTSLPSLLASGLGDVLKGLFQSQKMRELGEKGNQAKAEQSLFIQSIAKDDPIKAAIMPLITGFISSPDSPVPRYLRGTVDPIVRNAIANTPINFTEVGVPKVIDWIDLKFPQLKIKENLSAIEQLSKVSPVAE